MNRIATVVFLLALSLRSEAEVSLGDAGALAFGLGLDTRFTSNALLNDREVSDTIYTVIPTVHFRSRGGAITAEAFAGLAMIRYDQLGAFDSDDLRSRFRLSFPEEKPGMLYALELTGGFNQRSQPTAELNDVVETDDYDIGLKGKYFVSQYVSVRSGLTHQNSIAHTEGYADVSTLRFPVAVYYAYDEALNIGLGYSYRISNLSGVENAADSQDHTVFFAIEDLLSPLLQYEARVGYQYRLFANADAFEDKGAAFTQIALTWFWTEMTTLRLEASNEFSSSAANQSDQSLLMNLAINHAFDSRLSAAFGLTWEDHDYDQVRGQRSDDEWGVFAQATYQVTEDNWRLKARLAHAERRSTAASANFGLTELTLFCNFLF